MIIDLEVKLPSFNDTVYCIDEPELHLNTAIQRRLLNELAALIPDSCQLWVATHSIGFLRSLQKDQAPHAQILDFSAQDYFNGAHTITPIVPSRAHWKRIFSTALEDLTGLIAPEIVVYCEGRADPSPAGTEQGVDAQVYNQVFGHEFPEAHFVSSGGGGASAKHSGLALKVLSKALDSVTLLLLKDRDHHTDAERAAFLQQSQSHRMLKRREVENYLFDHEVLSRYALSQDGTIDQSLYDSVVTDIEVQDLKLGQTLQKLTQFSGFKGTVGEFTVVLAQRLTPGMATYDQLKACIF